MATKTTIAATTNNADPFITKHKSFRRKSADNVFAMAANIAQAEDDLGGTERKRFYNEIGLEKDGATHKKYKKIHEKAVRFEPYLDTLTGCWTTLWELAKLKDHEFERVAKANLLQETWPEISKFLRSTSSHKPSERLPLLIDLNSVKMAQRKDFVASLRKLFQDFEVTPTPAAKAVLEKCFGDNEEQKQAA